MPYLPYLYELSPLYLAQAALTIWMLVDASRRGVDGYWYWIILAFQPLGAWAYFFVYKVKDFPRLAGSLAALFSSRPSLDELRYRADRSPTVASHLELAERLMEAGEFAEAEPHLKAVLAREADHAGALFALSDCHRDAGRDAEAVPLLAKVVALRPAYRDYLAWHSLIESHEKAGDRPAAVAVARRLAQLVPSLEHKCLLARTLSDAGDVGEARRVLTDALEECKYARDLSRGDRRHLGRAKKQLADLG